MWPIIGLVNIFQLNEKYFFIRGNTFMFSFKQEQIDTAHKEEDVFNDKIKTK